MEELTKPSQNQYVRRIGTDRPGLILMLIDQSASMGGTKKKDAALAVNRVIYEIVLASQSGTDVKDRCHIGVIGYGRDITPVVGGMISEVAKNPIGVEILKQKVSDGAGGLVKVDIERPYWVEPKAENGTPMAKALEKAYALVETWANQNQESFPPVIINITDGEPNDFSRGSAPDTQKAATNLMKINTLDGNLLLFNAHFPGTSGQPIRLPSSEAELTDPYARLLFQISSVIPDSLIEEAKKVGFDPQPNARGFIFNADVEALIKLLTFGSSTFSR